MRNDLLSQIDAFLAFKTGMENTSARTSLAYYHDLATQFVPFLKLRNKSLVSEIIQQDIEDFLLETRKRSLKGSVSNMNRKLASIKSFLAYLEERELIHSNPCQKIRAPRDHKTTIAYLSEEDLSILIQTVETASTPFFRDRDISILKLFLGTGIRVSELTNLRVRDLELRTQGVSYIRIKRKGGSEASLPVNNRVVFAIRRYLRHREIQDISQPVFLSKAGQRMRANTVYYLVKHYLKRAGIEKKKWGPHLLRHTVGVSLRRQGVDIATIQHLLGHKKLETTAIYLNVESQDLEKAVQLL